jgi:peroxiredoxin
MPGRLTIGRWVPNGIERRNWFVKMATFDARSGETRDLKIGDQGCRVTGRLALPTTGIWMVRKASIETSPAQDPLHSYGVEVWADGRFRAEDLLPGNYDLRIDVHEPPPDNACGWGRLIAAFRRELTVSGDGPLDLGSLQPIEVGGKALQVGDLAPDFMVKTLDGKDLKLADFKGQFVLLDFWATWCAPCIAEIPNLKTVHDAFRSDPRLTIVSLSLDEKPGDAAYFVTAEKLPWPQGFVGPDSPVVAAYGATAIPAAFLIGPDRRILAKDLRGASIKALISERLKR